MTPVRGGDDAGWLKEPSGKSFASNFSHSNWWPESLLDRGSETDHLADVSGRVGMTVATMKRLEGEPMEEVSRPRTAGLSSGGMLKGSHISSRVSAWAPR